MYATQDSREELIVRLTRAIREHSSMELAQIREAGEHGADAGWPGFTYTSDGADFYRENSADIVALLSEEAEELGYENSAAMIAQFGRADMVDVVDGYECLLSWYALETCGRFWQDRADAR